MRGDSLAPGSTFITTLLSDLLLVSPLCFVLPPEAVGSLGAFITYLLYQAEYLTHIRLLINVS